MVDDFQKKGGPDMAGVGIQLAKRVGVALLADFLFYVGCKAVKNKANGKTIFGKKKEAKKDTYVDWKGNVILGTKDFCVD